MVAAGSDRFFLEGKPFGGAASWYYSRILSTFYRHKGERGSTEDDNTLLCPLQTTSREQRERRGIKKSVYCSFGRREEKRREQRGVS